MSLPKLQTLHLSFTLASLSEIQQHYTFPSSAACTSQSPALNVKHSLTRTSKLANVPCQSPINKGQNDEHRIANIRHSAHQNNQNWTASNQKPVLQNYQPCCTTADQPPNTKQVTTIVHRIQSTSLPTFTEKLFLVL